MKQIVEFNALLGQDETGVSTIDRGDVIDRKQFINFLIANYQPMGLPHARNLSYCINKVLRESGLRNLSVESAQSLATIILLSNYSKSNKRMKLIALEYWMTYIGTPMHIKKPQETKRNLKYLTEEQMNQLIKASHNYRDALIIEIFCTTGMRLSELSNLDFEDIDLEKGYICIKHGKGDREREVYLTNECKRFFNAYFQNWSFIKAKGPLFLSSRGTRLSNHAIGEIVKNTAKRANLPPTTPHVLRHSYATCFANKTNDVFVLQELMGHSTINMTKRYWHSTREVKKKSALIGAPSFS